MLDCCWTETGQTPTPTPWPFVPFPSPSWGPGQCLGGRPPLAGESKDRSPHGAPPGSRAYLWVRHERRLWTTWMGRLRAGREAA